MERLSRGYKSVVVDFESRAVVVQLQGKGCNTIYRIADEVYRPAVEWLRAQSGVTVEDAVIKDPHVVTSVIGLDAVVHRLKQVVVIHVNGHTLQVPRLLWLAVIRYSQTIPEPADPIVAYNVTTTVEVYPRMRWVVLLARVPVLVSARDDVIGDVPVG